MLQRAIHTMMLRQIEFSTAPHVCNAEPNKNMHVPRVYWIQWRQILTSQALSYPTGQIE